MRKFASITLLLLLGCSEKQTEPSSYSEPAYTKQYRNGAMTVVVSMSETNITSSGKIILLLEIHTPPEINPEFPDIGSTVDPFAVADGHSGPAESLPNGKRLHRKVWTLLPPLPGNTVFQALEISAGRFAVITEPVHISVKSLLPGEIDVYSIRDIAAPIDQLPEVKRRKKLGLLIASSTAAAGLIAGIAVWARRSRPVAAPPAPREAAEQALSRLPQDDLERIQALTGILLVYLGAELGIKTDSLTTPEIIRQFPKKVLLGRRKKLEQMLLASEQVRFSNKVPQHFPLELEYYIRELIEAVSGDLCD